MRHWRGKDFDFDSNKREFLVYEDALGKHKTLESLPAVNSLPEPDRTTALISEASAILPKQVFMSL